MRQLDGRVAVITGAGSGIGRATSLALAARGCQVAAVDVGVDGAEETAELVRRLGRRASAHAADVRDPDRMAELPDEVRDSLGPCRILVNNAGVTSAGAFMDEDPADLHWIIDINVWGVIHGCRAFLPTLLEADEAHIVNLSSMVGLLGLPHNVSYSLTKGAVRSFSEALRGELVTSPVGVTVVHPGAINTNIIANARGGQAARIAELGRSRLAPVLMRPPSAVADRIVRAIERNRARVVVGPDAHAVSVFARVIPGRSGLIGRLTNRLDR